MRIKICCGINNHEDHYYDITLLSTPLAGG